MNQAAIRVLYVDDSPFDRALVRDALEREGQGFVLTEAANRDEFERHLRSSDARFDLVLSDFNILGMTGLEVLSRVEAALPGTPVIIVTGTGSEEIAVEALKSGAADYVIKQPQHIRRLPQTILTILATREAKRDRDRTLALLAETEEHVRELRQLESLGRLAAGIAHDFNNLLTVIHGNVDSLSEDLPADSPLQREVSEIRAAARRAGDVTRGLLEFSSRDMSPAEPVDLAQLVRDCEPEIRAALPSGARLRLELASDPPLIQGRPPRLRQLLLTLTANAADALDGGGILTIRLDEFTPEPSHPPDRSGAVFGGAGNPLFPSPPMMRLQVQDNGHGMEPEVLERVFEPFFTTKELGDGTGLGLAAAFGTVRQAGGTISAESERGRGTTFTVLLPVPLDAP